jgi:hypothetical protein
MKVLHEQGALYCTVVQYIKFTNGKVYIILSFGVYSVAVSHEVVSLSLSECCTKG